jgi:exo-beta-1,3-glucanase (GH17 family)
MIELPTGRAICYSGYRAGQSPDRKVYPSLEQIREDLQLLRPHFQLLRLYDCSPHAERVLEVIHRDRLPFKVMLGAWLAAERNNAGCPWGGTYDEARLAANAAENEAEVGRLVELARAHEDIVFSVAVGNEAAVDWTDHFVPLPRLVEHVRRVKRAVRQPVTFCENYVPWAHQLRELAAELDFVSLHTYPVWEYKPVHEALAYTRANYGTVAQVFRDKPVVITEAGWTTNANGRGMPPQNASEAWQETYLRDLLGWADGEGILCFVFEAFDEPWKGSDDPLEPEKHWGLYTVDRQPKQAMKAWPLV